MNKINCTDRVLSLDNVESMRLIPRMDFVADTKDIAFFKKGEPFFKKHFWSKKKAFNQNMYAWVEIYTTMVCSGEEVVETMKKGLHWNFSSWRNFFIDSIEVIRQQIEYNKEKDCVTRKPTIVIRTKSGDTLYAVYDTDSSALDVINNFNGLC